ncbi:odorant receptor 13a-like isoform X1 [Temnothorax curvispinosus]|uniref:Odorant receptor n=1 Tax=Temnothorax curvispinosus TaxID=300111 RepID=A0A6J1QAB7_9HYME|nr:odorant receptor 13a-like isoform X1 [Temnothorax curvispinosus]
MVITSTVSPMLIIGLRFFGFWPGVSYSTIHWLSFMSSMLIIQYFQYLYIFTHLKISELTNLVDSLMVTLVYSLTFLKLIGLWIHRRVLHKILVDMDNDWRECINVDQHLHIMTIKANVSHFCSNVLLSINTIGSALYLLGDDVVRFIFPTKDYNVTIRQLPIKIQFPFETQQSPIFEFFVVSTFLHGMLQVWSIAILNGLIITLVHHVSGQVDVICQEFRNISRTTLLYRSSLSSFGILVKRHNRIISFSENIEELFSFIALMQVVWNTLVICCLGFIIILSIHNETGVFALMKTMIAYLAITMEAFIICFAGEYLSFKGKSIARATYETPWYDMPSKQNKIIIFILMKSQKRLAITAGKMMDMSFETFTSIMKASVSYVSVLYAML